ncbi:MAG TPA: hypothetical protein DCR14_10775 [Acidimicrobiaceae bacterium]|nr:hypothetical protein [Acidimicrobiaceae bacterium]
MADQDAGTRRTHRVTRATLVLVSALLIGSGGGAESAGVAVSNSPLLPLTERSTAAPELTPTAATPRCVAHRGRPAATLDRLFANGHRQQLGVLGGFDEPTVYTLGPGRQVWMLHDAYLDLDRSGTTYPEQSYLHNLALLVETGLQQLCVTPLYQRSANGSEPIDFEPGPLDSADHRRRTMHRWYWALGGGLDADGNLTVLWAEMVEDRGPIDQRGPLDGITRHPERVWRAVYDPTTLARLSFTPAADPAILPMYGTAVVDDPVAGFTYLFGNSLDRNLTRSGGYQAGPHPGTFTYLARVPLGRYESPPQYWTGDGWGNERAAAQPIHHDGWVEWLMQPRLIDGRWVSITKVDAWWSPRWVVQVADDPTGPWTIATEELLHVPSLGRNTTSPLPDAMRQATYTPVIVDSWSSADRLTVVMSQNGWDWHAVCMAAHTEPFYWPEILAIDLSGSTRT